MRPWQGQSRSLFVSRLRRVTPGRVAGQDRRLEFAESPRGRGRVRRPGPLAACSQARSLDSPSSSPRSRRPRRPATEQRSGCPSRPSLRPSESRTSPARESVERGAKFTRDTAGRTVRSGPGSPPSGAAVSSPRAGSVTPGMRMRGRRRAGSNVSWSARLSRLGNVQSFPRFPPDSLANVLAADETPRAPRPQATPAVFRSFARRANNLDRMQRLIRSSRLHNAHESGRRLRGRKMPWTRSRNRRRSGRVARYVDIRAAGLAKRVPICRRNGSVLRGVVDRLV